MKIDLHWKDDNHPPSTSSRRVQVYRRCQEAFKRRNIELRFQPNIPPAVCSDADLFIIQPNHEFRLDEEQIIALRRPIIIDERLDSATVNERTLLQASNVVRLLKPAVVSRDLIDLNTSQVHCFLADEAKPEFHHQRLTDEQFAKIKPGIHVGMFEVLKRWIDRCADIISWEARPVDVLFMGSVDKYNDTINRHRRRFCEALKAIRDLNIICTMKRCMPKQTYVDFSFYSKIVVSPWGHGELCYRDFEAFLTGSVLIKPISNHMRTLDDIVLQDYVPCKIDASDLEQVIHSVLAKAEYKEPIFRMAHRQKVVDWWSADRIANWFVDELAEIGLTAR